MKTLPWCCWSQWGTWWDDRCPCPIRQLVANHIPELCRRSHQWTWLHHHPQLWPEKDPTQVIGMQYNSTHAHRTGRRADSKTMYQSRGGENKTGQVTLHTHLGLLLKQLPLSDRIIQLSVSIADFLLHHKELKTLSQPFVGSVPETSVEVLVWTCALLY